MSDELHQAFVRGRHASPVDVAIDTVGLLIGLLGVAPNTRRLESTDMEHGEVGDRQLDALLERLDKLTEEVARINRRLDGERGNLARIVARALAAERVAADARLRRARAAGARRCGAPRGLDA